MGYINVALSSTTSPNGITKSLLNCQPQTFRLFCLRFILPLEMCFFYFLLGYCLFCINLQTTNIWHKQGTAGRMVSASAQRCWWATWNKSNATGLNTSVIVADSLFHPHQLPPPPLLFQCSLLLWSRWEDPSPHCPQYGASSCRDNPVCVSKLLWWMSGVERMPPQRCWVCLTTLKPICWENSWMLFPC